MRYGQCISQPNLPQTSTSGTHTHIDNTQPHTK